MHARNEAAAADRIVREIRDGNRVAVVTDAGMPGISDPGAQLVRACLDAELPVEAVPGPSAALTAVVLSGLPSDRFVFEGFLPRKARARAERIARLADEPRTTVLFEAPGRVREQDAGAGWESHRPVAVAGADEGLRGRVAGTLGEAVRRAERTARAARRRRGAGPGTAPAGDAEIRGNSPGRRSRQPLGAMRVRHRERPGRRGAPTTPLRA